MRGRYLRRHPLAGVAELDDDVIPVSPRCDLERAHAVHRVNGVVDEVGPHLVELAGVCVDPRDVCAVGTNDLHTVAELVVQHHQGALDADRHVDVLDRRAIHLRVRPDRADEIGDAPGRLLHLREERGHGERAGHPLQARLQGRSRKQVRRLLAPGEVDSSGSERRSDDPVTLDAVVSDPRRQDLLLVGEGQRVEDRGTGHDLTTQRVERRELRG